MQFGNLDNPLRLGGQRVLALSETPESRFAIPTEPESESIDIDALLADLEFTYQQREWIRVNKALGISRSQAAAELGWSMQTVEAVRKSTDRRLKSLAATKKSKPVVAQINNSQASGEFARVGSYREALSSGHKCWSLWPSNPVMPEILAE